MQILVNGLPAAIKKGTSFDICFENRYFSGADGYSMAITFPLKDCQQNLAIFGHINRRDVEAQSLLLDAEIRDREFTLIGSIAITSITNLEVKTQFLEGRSASNYSCSFDSIYLNELRLGYPPPTKSAQSPIYMGSYDYGTRWVSLPWVNNSSGNVQNDVNLDAGGATWAASPMGVSYQPYMLYILKQIFTVLGYTYDIEALENSPYRYMLICNTLPYAWELYDFALALPHWTLTEFFEQLEYLLNGEFNFDHSRKRVSFSFTKNVVETIGSVELTKVIDDFTINIEDASDCKYYERKTLKYADCDHYMWKYYSCPEAVAECIRQNGDQVWSSMYRPYDTMEQLSSWAVSKDLTNYTDSIAKYGFGALFYVRDVDRYFLLRRVAYHQTGEGTYSNGEKHPIGYYEFFLQCVNNFGPRMADEDAESIELKIVPAWLGDTTSEKGPVIFLEMPDYANEGASRPYNGYSDWFEAVNHLRTNADFIVNAQSEQGSKEGAEYLDKIYVGFFKGGTQRNRYLHPVLDVVDVKPSGEYTITEFSQLCLAKGDRQRSYDIDPTKKHTIKFLSKSVPNVRSLFYIQGKRYLCEKLTTSFSDEGRSELIKGDFWEVVE